MAFIFASCSKWLTELTRYRKECPTNKENESPLILSFSFLEIRYIIILFALLTLVWLFAGLHVTFGYEWMLITFIVLDGILVS